MKYPTLCSSEFRMNYDEYDLQIVTRDVILSYAKCDYKLITLRDSLCALLHRGSSSSSARGVAGYIKLDGAVVVVQDGRSWRETRKCSDGGAWAWASAGWSGSST